MENLVKSMEERGGTKERSRTGLIKGKKKNECGVGAGKRTIVNKNKKEPCC